MRDEDDVVLVGEGRVGRDLGRREDVREDEVPQDEVGAAGDVVERLGVGRNAVDGRSGLKRVSSGLASSGTTLERATATHQKAR